ncbi:MAG: ammonium transporter, partial [Armatimonadota bacterium]
MTSATRGNKISRLRERLSSPEWRSYGYALAAGKGIGILFVFAIMVMASGMFGGAARAADPVVKANDIINPLNTLWVLLAAFLVFGMQ